MKVLFITHAVFLDPTRISTGNSVRGFFLAKGLAERGHLVIFAGPSGLERFASKTTPEPGIQVTTFAGRAGLVRLLEECRPDVLLVGYWELLDELPETLEMPVVLDVGIYVDDDGKMCGDVDFEAAEKIVGSITPVPGGVGTVTTSVLVKHVAEAAQKQAGL